MSGGRACHSSFHVNLCCKCVQADQKTLVSESRETPGCHASDCTIELSQGCLRILRQLRPEPRLQGEAVAEGGKLQMPSVGFKL